MNRRHLFKTLGLGAGGGLLGAASLASLARADVVNVDTPKLGRTALDAYPARYKYVNIPQAQVYTLFSVPQTLIAADPGGGMWFTDNIVVFKESGAAYTGGTGNIQIGFGSGTYLQATLAQLLGTTGTTIIFNVQTYQLLTFSTAAALAINIRLQTADPTPASGAGGLQLGIWYRLIPNNVNLPQS